MHRRYQEVCEAQQLAAARNKLLLEDVTRMKRKFSAPTGSRLELLKSQYQDHVIKLYPVWLEQLQQLRTSHQIGTTVTLSSTIQHPGLSHTHAVHHHIAMPTLVTNSDSSHVSSDSLATPSNERGSVEPAITFNQSDHFQPPVHTSQHGDISLLSSSSGIDHVDALIDSSSIKSDQGVNQSDQDNALITSNMNSDQGNQEDSSTSTSSIKSDQGNQDGTPSSMKSDLHSQATPNIVKSDQDVDQNNQINHSRGMKFSQKSDQDNTLTSSIKSDHQSNQNDHSSDMKLSQSDHNNVLTPSDGMKSDQDDLVMEGAGEQLSISHDVTSTDDDDNFWNSEAPSTTHTTSAAINSNTIDVTTLTVSVSATPPIITTVAKIQPVISSKVDIPSSTNAPPTSTTSSNIASLFTTASRVTPITTSVVMPTCTLATPSNSSSSSSLSRLSLTQPSRPAASDVTNQTARQQLSVAKMESSTSAGIKEHVPLTETAAYQSLAKSLHQDVDESSLISEGSAILELEQDLLSNISSSKVSPRQMSLLPSNLVTDHDSDNSEGVKGTHHQSPPAMESDDDNTSLSSPSGGGGGYVPSMLEQRTATHTSHVVDLRKLATSQVF
ncbi:uncharacterized protein [Dysidea avara]|uniref:uncharacterized protein isoform X2 n=1 Tax=Dysidea avara TaxID=196820 RepID=UPI00331E5D29